MTRLAAFACVVAALVASACTVNVSKSDATSIVKNQCTPSSDCGAGTCFVPSGACVAYGGTLSNLLVEITPPVNAGSAGIGGVRFLQLESGLERSNEQHDLDILGASTVHGYIKASCPLEVTLTSQAESYGLPVPVFVTQTTTLSDQGGNGTASTSCQSALSTTGAMQEFSVNVPPGTYDAYVRPVSTVSAGVDAGAPPPCIEAPALFRGIIKATAGVSCVSLLTHPVQSLQVEIPWPSSGQSLDGWILDVVHPVTGQVLSEPVTIKGNPKEPTDFGIGYSYPLKYSQAVADDTTKPGQELVRLSPPRATPGAGPVIQLSVVALTASSSPPTPTAAQKAEWPPMAPFPSTVHMSSWVWDANDVAVPSTVTFTSKRIEGLSDGIFASFSTSVVVGQDGRLEADLFPGDYVARTVPAIDPNMIRNLAAQEQEWPVSGRGPQQGGRVLLIQSAATLRGQAVSAFQAGISAATIQALPASVDTRRCQDADAAACASKPLGVLEESLAESAFVARPVSGVTGGDGKFILPGVDCGGCQPQTAGAFLDVIVRPPDGSRLPWAVRTRLDVNGDLDLDKIQGTLPIIQRGLVQVPQSPGPKMGSSPAAPVPVPGALIKAYVVRDASGAVIPDPTGLPSCSTGTYSGAQAPGACIRSVVQVAQTLAGPDARYELVLPSSLDAPPPQ